VAGFILIAVNVFVAFKDGETSVTLVKKHLPVCSSLLSPPSDSSVTLSIPSATLLVESSESAVERPTIFRPLKAVTIVKTPPRPRPLAIVQSLRPSIAAEGGASTSAARHPYLTLQPSSPIPGGSNAIVYDDSPALPIEIQETAAARYVIFLTIIYCSILYFEW